MVFHQAFQLVGGELVFIFIHTLALQDTDKTAQHQHQNSIDDAAAIYSSVCPEQLHNHISDSGHTYAKQTEFQAGIDLFLPGCPLLIQILHHRMQSLIGDDSGISTFPFPSASLQ